MVNKTAFHVTVIKGVKLYFTEESMAYSAI